MGGDTGQGSSLRGRGEEHGRGEEPGRAAAGGGGEGDWPWDGEGCAGGEDLALDSICARLLAASASTQKPSRPSPLRQISAGARIRIRFRAASTPISRASVPLPHPPRAAFAPLSSAYHQDGRLPT